MNSMAMELVLEREVALISFWSPTRRGEDFLDRTGCQHLSMCTGGMSSFRGLATANTAARFKLPAAVAATTTNDAEIESDATRSTTDDDEEADAQIKSAPATEPAADAQSLLMKQQMLRSNHRQVLLPLLMKQQQMIRSNQLQLLPPLLGSNQLLLPLLMKQLTLRSNQLQLLLPLLMKQQQMIRSNQLQLLLPLLIKVSAAEVQRRPDVAKLLQALKQLSPSESRSIVHDLPPEFFKRAKTMELGTGAGDTVVGFLKQSLAILVPASFARVVGDTMANAFLKQYLSFLLAQPYSKAGLALGLLLLGRGVLLQVKRRGCYRFMIRLGSVVTTLTIVEPMVRDLPPWGALAVEVVAGLIMWLVTDELD